MEFDVFFSISQTPDTTGYTPSESEMFTSFFDQVVLADKLGFGVGWVAQAHLSTEIQKRNSKPVVPHYPGEVGLCTDFFQVAREMFARTERMEVGSAVMSILASGGPIAQAERVGSFLALHGMDPDEVRKLHIGFSAGRFEFMASREQGNRQSSADSATLQTNMCLTSRYQKYERMTNENILK